MFLFTFMRKRLCLRTTCPEKNLEFQAVWKMGASGERNCQARYEQHVDRAIYLTLVATRCRLGPSSPQFIQRRVWSRGNYYPPQFPEIVLTVDANIRIWCSLAALRSSTGRAHKYHNGIYQVLTESKNGTYSRQQGRAN